MSDVLQEVTDAYRDKTLHELVVKSLQGLGVMAVLSVGFGWAIAGRVLGPLHRMTATARRLSEENLHERIALDGPDDELKELADTFDAMLGRLESAFDSQKRFVANASHELRTPLSIMRTEVDVTLADPDATPDELRRMGEVVRRATERSDALIDGLLVLARSDRGPATLAPVDLAGLADEAVTQAAAEAAAAGVELSGRLDPAPTNGDAALLGRLAGNLIENAIRHNEPGGRVEVVTGPASDAGRGPPGGAQHRRGHRPRRRRRPVRAVPAPRRRPGRRARRRPRAVDRAIGGRGARRAGHRQPAPRGRARSSRSSFPARNHGPAREPFVRFRTFLRGEGISKRSNGFKRASLKEWRSCARFRMSLLGLAVAALVLLSRARAARASNDPSFKDAVGAGQDRRRSAWARTTGARVRVGIVDTGVDLDHEDLAGKVVESRPVASESGGDPAKCNGTAQDDQGHGTHVGGIAAAIQGQRARASPAWPPTPSWSWPRCSAPQGTGDRGSDVTAGIKWVVDHGAKVVNLIARRPGPARHRAASAHRHEGRYRLRLEQGRHPRHGLRATPTPAGSGSKAPTTAT